jgi:hypothetical protein
VRLSCLGGLHLSKYRIELFRRQAFAAKKRSQSVHQEQLDTDKFSKEMFVERPGAVDSRGRQYLIP